MSFTDDRDKNTEYQKVEVEIDPDSSDDPLSSYPRLTQTMTKLQAWFNNLPVPAKIAVGIVAIMLVFKILTAFLQLIYALLSVLILGGLLYLGYRFLLAADRQ